MAIYAKVIEDSINSKGDRLTSMEVEKFRFTLSELNTHRRFSRNSASSRAIPVHKQIARVMEDPAIPISFPREQSGMQGGEQLTGQDRIKAEYAWLQARDAAVKQAEIMVALGVHKSVTNRVLEPFMWHKVIVSSTEWDNFFLQRANPLAQPEIQQVAFEMYQALEASTPRELDNDDWHTPYITDEERAELDIETRVRISAARCARVSYLTHDGIRDTSVDLDLYYKLVSANPPHWSPLEHVACPDELDLHPSNFDGWIQLRAIEESVRATQTIQE